MFLPSKSTIKGLFAGFAVVNTRTAFAVGDVVVSGRDVVVRDVVARDVARDVVVTSGDVVVSVHE